MPTIEEIKDTFEFFDDWEDRYNYIIDLGKRLPDMSESLRIEANLVRGCQSLVWIVMSYDSDTEAVTIQLDSDAFIVRGLIAILLTVYQNQTPEAIRDVDSDSLFAELGLLSHLSPTRGNGLRAMVARIQAEAAQIAT